jgi:hypothetical protein
MCGNRTDAPEGAPFGAHEIVTIAAISNAARRAKPPDRHALDILADAMISHSIHAGHGLFQENM